INVEPRDYTGGSKPGSDARGGRGGFDDGMGGGAEASSSAPLGQDFSVAHTGRAGWPRSTNPVYDVR
ncbi:MAG: hypothetical protein KDA05_07465, partial [Phycisphaerales bacterium]|nr:hypothetical protein [Phycisphaerales bacterium]